MPRLQLPLLLITSFLCVVVAGAASAQQVPNTPPPAAIAANTQFDFLLGNWQIEARPKVSSLVAFIHGAPTLLGSWHASRATDGAIEDDLNVVDASGNPVSTLHSRRVFVVAPAHWQIDAHDLTRGRHSSMQSSWRDGEIRLEGSSTDSDGTVSLLRIRYFAISPNDFDVQQDRSIDQGQSWDEAALMIHAHRVAAAAAP